MQIQTARLSVEGEYHQTPHRICGYRTSCEKRFVRIPKIFNSRLNIPITIETIRTLKDDSDFDRNKLYSAEMS
jgi:hypothetical protein